MVEVEVGLFVTCRRPSKTVSQTRSHFTMMTLWSFLHRSSRGGRTPCRDELSLKTGWWKSSAWAPAVLLPHRRDDTRIVRLSAASTATVPNKV